MLDLAFRPFRLYASFRGRSSRVEFWLFALLQLLVNVLIVAVIAYASRHAPRDAIPSGMPLGDVIAYLWFVYILLSIIPFYAVVARRYHDLGDSGWMCLCWMIPMAGPVIVLFNMLHAGAPAENKYGPAPVR